MGRTLALNLASRGCHLALSDVNSAGLQETAQMAAKAGVKVTTALIDVADREQMQAWADAVVRDHGRVNLIFNNAGWPWAPRWIAPQARRFRVDLGINFWGGVGHAGLCRT